jgi:hypothetical protein
MPGVSNYRGVSLLPAERAKMTRLEAQMRTDKVAVERFIANLVTIRDEKLYKADYKTFEAYCQERWGISRQHAHRHIEFFKTVQAIEGPDFVTIGDKTGPAPLNESVARPLSGLPDETRREAWSAAVEDSGGKPTRAHVKKAVAKVTGDPDTDKAIADGIIPPGAQIWMEDENGVPVETFRAPRADDSGLAAVDSASEPDRKPCPHCSGTGYVAA